MKATSLGGGKEIWLLSNVRPIWSMTMNLDCNFVLTKP